MPEPLASVCFRDGKTLAHIRTWPVGSNPRLSVVDPERECFFRYKFVMLMPLLADSREMRHRPDGVCAIAVIK